MSKFKERHFEPELMDDPAVDPMLLQKNLRELDFANWFFGGNKVTREGLKKLIEHQKLYTLVDIGCGGGGTLKYLAEWARRKKLKIRFVGVDANQHAIDFLKVRCSKYPEISGVARDYKEFLKITPVADIYLCSLFCHHLDNESLLTLFRQLKKAKTGFVINDLQRSPWAYYVIWLFTRLFRGTVLSKNDGPLSVRKAFRKEELEHLLWIAGCKVIEIKKHWLFRIRVVVRNSQD